MAVTQNLGYRCIYIKTDQRISLFIYIKYHTVYIKVESKVMKSYPLRQTPGVKSRYEGGIWKRKKLVCIILLFVACCLLVAPCILMAWMMTAQLAAVNWSFIYQELKSWRRTTVCLFGCTGAGFKSHYDSLLKTSA